VSADRLSSAHSFAWSAVPDEVAPIESFVSVARAARRTVDGSAFKAAYYTTSMMIELEIELATFAAGMKEDHGRYFRAKGQGELRLAQLLREVFGNPFHTLPLDPAFLAPAVAALARAIYTDRAFDRMPELGEVLESAGCTNADVLAHCREPGPHVRGCWVLDILLGKE